MQVLRHRPDGMANGESMLITVFVELPYTNHANYADAPSFHSFPSGHYGGIFPAPPLAPPALWKLLMLHQCNVTAPVLIIIIIITDNNN